MLEYFLIGSGFAFTAAIQPGPLQAFLLSSVAQKGWKRTLLACFSPLLSDGPIAVLVLLVLNHIPEYFSSVLQAAGGLFLLYLAWSSYKQWKKQATASPERNDSAPRTLFQAALVNLLNPNPYIGWSLVLGPAFLQAWHQDAAYAVVLILSFYLTLIIALAGTILLFGTTRYLSPKGRRILILVSALLLAALGSYLVAAGMVRFFTG
jgi:threonine/homoserine/homoserine lactone efflux protein